MALPRIEVAAVVLRRKDGKVLLAERRPNQIAGGYWEVPGGKIEPGETPEQAARRELAEEVGVTAERLRPGPVQEHQFPIRRVRLHFFFADDWVGEPQGLERQRVAWFDPEHPAGPVLPSNTRILAAQALPPVYGVVSAKQGTPIADILNRCAAALSNGARAIQLRAPHLTPDQRVGLARRVALSTAEVGARLMMVGTAIEANRAGVDGLHSTADQLRVLNERPQVPLWAASCHDERDIEKAVLLGADFIVVSPVLPSSSHPESPSLGWQRLQAIAANTPVPVFAQGGMAMETLNDALAVGAAGIAISASAIARSLGQAA